jgi:putative endonuclease
MTKCFVYVLVSRRDGGLYIGLAQDVQHRLREHNLGRQRSTKARTPFDLLLFEEFPTRQAARERERFYKTGYGREILKARLRESIVREDRGDASHSTRKRQPRKQRQTPES